MVSDGKVSLEDGSSPLTRGKLTCVLNLVAICRLIPAHAGKTTVLAQRTGVSEAHPRSRGENSQRPGPRSTTAGSSPLTRGKPPPTMPSRPSRRAHPRSRGENVSRAVDGIGTAGSSPLTRGKHFLTCAFTAQIDQILETLELAASFGSYLIWVACATDAPQDPVRSIGLVLPSSMGAS